MKPLHLFTFRATEEQLATALKWASFSSARQVIPHKIPQERPEEVLKDGDVVVSFGKFAGDLVEQTGSELHHIALPSFKKLAPTEENSKSRQQAREEIEQLSSLLNENEMIIEKEDIEQVVDEDKLLDSLQETRLLTKKSGENIEINKDGNSCEHTAISFAELFAIKQVMSVLGVEQVRLTRTNKEKERQNVRNVNG